MKSLKYSVWMSVVYQHILSCGGLNIAFIWDFVNKVHSINLNFLSTEIYSVNKYKILPMLHTMHHGRFNWKTVYVLSFMDIGVCPRLWISDKYVHKSTDPLSVRVWVEMDVVKFHTMTLFVKVNCFPAPHFLLRNLFWILFEIILSALHRPASGSDDLEVKCGMCLSATLRMLLPEMFSCLSCVHSTAAM